MIRQKLLKEMARLGRLELPTYGFEVRRSIQLSYRREYRFPSYNKRAGGIEADSAIDLHWDRADRFLKHPFSLINDSQLPQSP